MVPLKRGTEREQALDLLVPGAVLGLEIQMHAVLHRLAVIDPDEQQGGSSSRDHGFRIPRKVVISQRAVQSLGPKARKNERVGGVEGEMAYQRTHAPSRS